jgi:ssRNA-specific RNase YbeY (16S rRNA maturation enzyme)
MEPILAQKLDKNSNVHTQLELYIVSFTKIRKLNNDWN